MIKRLKAGEDFAKVAKEVSKDTGSDGGDLGWFTKDKMVPEFAEAAFKLEPGTISEPVKSPFGWHVIEVEGKREKTFPPFDEVKDQVSRYVVQKAQSELVTELRKTREDRPRRARGRSQRRARAPPRARRRAARRAGRREEVSERPKSGARTSSSRAGSGWPRLARRALFGPIAFRISDVPAPAGRPPEGSHRRIAPMAALSPLAPKSYPDLPEIEGVRFAAGEAGIRYKGRTDVMLALFDKGTEVAGVFTTIEMPLGAGRLVPRAAAGRQGAGARRQFRQRQRLHRQGRRAGDQAHRGHRGEGHRRAADARSSSPRRA